VIYDRDGEVLVNNVAGLNVTVVPEEIGRGKLSELAEILEADTPTVLERYDAAKASGSSYSPILVRENAASEAVTYVSERTGEFPGLSVQDEYVRNYPLGPTASHVLGHTGAVSREELEGSDGELDHGVVVGKSGIELVYEDLLRRDPGQRTYSVDAQGRIVDADQQVASEEERERIEAAPTEEPVPGKNLRLSLDLQRTVEEELNAPCRPGSGRAMRQAAPLRAPPRDGRYPGDG
jgi:penicillin-binding protein 2